MRTSSKYTQRLEGIFHHSLLQRIARAGDRTHLLLQQAAPSRPQQQEMMLPQGGSPTRPQARPQLCPLQLMAPLARPLRQPRRLSPPRLPGGPPRPALQCSCLQLGHHPAEEMIGHSTIKGQRLSVCVLLTSIKLAGKCPTSADGLLWVAFAKESRLFRGCPQARPWIALPVICTPDWESIGRGWLPDIDVLCMQEAPESNAARASSCCLLQQQYSSSLAKRRDIWYWRTSGCDLLRSPYAYRAYELRKKEAETGVCMHACTKGCTWHDTGDEGISGRQCSTHARKTKPDKPRPQTLTHTHTSRGTNITTLLTLHHSTL